MLSVIVNVFIEPLKKMEYTIETLGVENVNRFTR